MVGQSKPAPDFGSSGPLISPLQSWIWVGKLGQMRLLAGALTLSAVIVLGIAAFEALPAPSNGPAHGIVWSGQTFATRADFARWLRSQGVTYRAWARSHPAEAGLTRGPEHSGWSRSPGVLAGIAALLGALALGVALVRRRWPESGASAAHLIEVIGLRGAAAIGAGARSTSRRAALTARRSMARATAATSGARHPTGGSAAHRLEVVGLRGAAAGEAGLRTTRRWAALTARRSMDLATAAAFEARHGIGKSAARRLEVGARGGAGAAEAGVRRALRWAALTTQRLTGLATASAFSVRRRRPELAWYVTTTLLAAGMGVVVTVWLNRG
jgi:hypothetical protein